LNAKGISGKPKVKAFWKVTRFFQKSRETKAKGHMKKKKSKRIITIRETSVQQAKKMIEEYLNQHQGPVYPSDIANHYGLELEPVFEAIKQLKAK
jgi:hypothetical protein